MSTVQKAHWKHLGEDAARKYLAEKKAQEMNEVRYSLSSAGQAAAAKLKKKAVATATAKVKAKAPVKSAIKKSTAKSGAKVVKKKVTIKRPAAVRVCINKSRVSLSSVAFMVNHRFITIKKVKAE